MINPINNLGSSNIGNAVPPASAPCVNRTSVADALKNSIDEAARLQQDASRAVEELTGAKPHNLSGVMSAVEKSDLAYKTLLAIRAKLMDAYDEIRNLSL